MQRELGGWRRFGLSLGKGRCQQEEATCGQCTSHSGSLGSRVELKLLRPHGQEDCRMGCGQVQEAGFAWGQGAVGWHALSLRSAAEPQPKATPEFTLISLRILLGARRNWAIS